LEPADASFFSFREVESPFRQWFRRRRLVAMGGRRYFAAPRHPSGAEACRLQMGSSTDGAAGRAATTFGHMYGKSRGRTIRRAFVWAVIALLVFTLVATLMLEPGAEAAIAARR
jgi:hypothetical protein